MSYPKRKPKESRCPREKSVHAEDSKLLALTMGDRQTWYRDYAYPLNPALALKKENKAKISAALTKRDKDCQLNGITVCRNGFCHSTLMIKIDKGCKARTSEEPSQLYMLSEPI